jgi:hypothetical protein
MLSFHLLHHGYPPTATTTTLVAIVARQPFVHFGFLQHAPSITIINNDNDEGLSASVIILLSVSDYYVRHGNQPLPLRATSSFTQCWGQHLLSLYSTFRERVRARAVH